jgi:hypothetical protein
MAETQESHQRVMRIVRKSIVVESTPHLDIGVCIFFIFTSTLEAVLLGKLFMHIYCIFLTQ